MKTRIGIIGVGGIAVKRHIPAFLKHPDVEIVAVCDNRPEVLDKVAADLDIKHKFAYYEDLVNLDDIDVIDICTPNFAHADPTIQALENGKHVIVEKPLARNAVEGTAMIEAAEKAGKQLMVAFCMRWRPDARAIKDVIDKGDMGDIYYATAQALRQRGIPNWGVFTDKEKQGGGPLIDMGIHALDLALWFMGHPRPLTASGTAYTKFGNRSGLSGDYGPWDSSNYTVEDYASALIRFENGASLSIESSFAANIRDKSVFDVKLLGTRGGAELNPFYISREEAGLLIDVTPSDLPEALWHEAELFDVIYAIRNNHPVPSPGSEALIATKIVDAIYRSAEEGREVSVG
jgi:predicted dehydrogenase